MTSSSPLSLTAAPGRLDAVLAELTGVSRSQVAGWIAGGHVQVGGVVAARASLKLRGGEALTVAREADAIDGKEPDLVRIAEPADPIGLKRQGCPASQIVEVRDAVGSKEPNFARLVSRGSPLPIKI